MEMMQKIKYIRAGNKRTKMTFVFANFRY